MAIAPTACWLKTPVHIRELEELDKHPDWEMTPARIMADTHKYIDNTARLGSELFGEYIRLFSSKVRRVALPSR
jgi:hypothetical protein